MMFPVGRFARPEEIAAFWYFKLSHDSVRNDYTAAKYTSG